MYSGDFFRERLFKGTTLVPEAQRSSFEATVQSLRRDVNFAEPERNKLLLASHEWLTSHLVPERQTALILALIDGGFDILDRANSCRGKVRDAIGEEVAELQSELDELRIQLRESPLSNELRGEIADVINEIQSLQSIIDRLDEPQSFEILDGILTERSTEYIAPRSSAKFEGPYVRAEAKFHGGKNWPRFRDRVMEVLGLPKASVGSQRAWRADTLVGGKSVDDLVDEIRGRAAKASTPSSDSPAEVLENAPNLQELYSHIDEGDQAYARSLQPATFEHNGEITNQQHRWILGVVALAPDRRKKSAARKILAGIFSLSPFQVGAYTAYLTGGCRQAVRRPELLAAIEAIEAYLAQRQSEDRVEEDSHVEIIETAVDTTTAIIEVVPEEVEVGLNPNYDNEAKRLGWREPEARMIESAFGRRDPLRGRRILMLESPQLLEWQMLERMGAEEQRLTIVERDKRSADELQRKLPRADVRHTTLIDFMMNKADARLGERLETWRNRGLNQKDPSSYICSLGYTRIPIDPRLVEFINPGDDATREFRSHPYATRYSTVGIPDDSRDRYDLVSLDTKSLLETELYAIQLLFKLNLLADNSVLATAFLGHRESEQAKQLYKATLRTQQVYEFRGANWTDRTKDPLKDQRSTAISLRLIDYANSGRNFLGGVFVGNPDSPLIDELIPDFGSILPGRFETRMNPYSAAYCSETPGVEVFEPVYMWEALIDLAVEERMLRRFIPLLKALAPKNLRRIDLRKDKFSGRVFEAHQSLAMTLGDAVHFKFSEALSPASHEAKRYRAHQTTMMTDFIHFRRLLPSVGYSHQQISALLALLEGRIKGRDFPVKARDLVKPSAGLIEEIYRKDDLVKSLQREDV